MREYSEDVDSRRKTDGLDVYWVRTDATQARWLGLAIHDQDHATLAIFDGADGKRSEGLLVRASDGVRREFSESDEESLKAQMEACAALLLMHDAARPESEAQTSEPHPVPR